MSYNRIMSELDATKAQLATFFIIILLALDSTNPVKIFLHVFPQVEPWHIATMSSLMIIYIFISEIKSLLYFGIKVYFQVLLSIFFKEIEVIGRANIPTDGPVIFTGNHANQFVDALIIMCTCMHKLSPLIASKSWVRPVVGHLAWAIGCVPVKRPQDSAEKGLGVVIALENEHRAVEQKDLSQSLVRLNGRGTKFTEQIKIADKIRLPGNIVFKVVEIVSDTVLVMEGTIDSQGFEFSEQYSSYDILGKVDQSGVYDAVLSRLGEGGAIGIFPEGGSHDQTDILPLKAGVSIIAFSALSRDGLNIPVIPVGLSYFRGHRFRARAVIEYGAPLYVDQNKIDAYKKGGTEKRKVCNDFLQEIADGMRAVLVTSPNYETLQMIYTARRLYQRRVYTVSQKQDVTRRFAEGYKLLLLQTRGKPPQHWLSLQNRLIEYQNELNDLGIRDYQVVRLGHKMNIDDDGDIILREMRISLKILKLLFVLLLAFLPSAILNLPVGLLARYYAEKKRKKALASSKVKILARDVMLSEKIIFCIVMVPMLWMIYALMLMQFTVLDGPAITVAVFSMPLFSYMGVMATEKGMIDIKDIKPYFIRVFPSTRRRLQRLPFVRKDLQHDLRRFIKELGPLLGELYYGKKIDWKQIVELSRSINDSSVDESSDATKNGLTQHKNE